MPGTQNDLLIHYFQWIHVEKMEKRVIRGKEHNLNAGNLKDCADKSISDDAADELMATSRNYGDSTDFLEMVQVD